MKKREVKLEVRITFRARKLGKRVVRVRMLNVFQE